MKRDAGAWSRQAMWKTFQIHKESPSRHAFILVVLSKLPEYMRKL